MSLRNMRPGDFSPLECYKLRTDEETVSRWLADRGLVAVERDLMDKLTHIDGKPRDLAAYHVDEDVWRLIR